MKEGISNMMTVGIDIGSTCSKTAVMDAQGNISELFVLPTGWSSIQAMEDIRMELKSRGTDPENALCISTGYGRKAVPFAQGQVTEISCHARGAAALFLHLPINVIDVGGQDTKVISCTDGRVEEFHMNEKCAAGTGKFVEVMANRLVIPIDSLDDLARFRTKQIEISSLCTVFAESEVVALAGQGESKENIAWGVLNSVAKKVAQEYSKLRDQNRPVFLTGGLCSCTYFIEILSARLKREVSSHPDARYAGAIGAALLARERFGRE